MALQIIVKNSSVSGNEPTAGQLANGELALNYHANGPFITCKDTAGVVRRVTGVWVNAAAPSSPTPGELWLDISVTPAQLKVYKDVGDAWVAAITVYAATTSVAGVVQLSDSISTTSSILAATPTAVKTAYDLANAALPKTGGTVTGNLEIGTAGSLSFEGATADGFETTIAITDPTADRTITLPNTTGTVVTTGDTGTVTSTMILDGTIVDADINASAEIAVSKLADGTARQLLQTDAAGTGVEWASNIDIPGTLDVTSAATFDSTVTIAGDLTVNGTTTNINTVNLTVEDKNIIIADVVTPSDVTADGGGITLKGATDKTINWIDATDAWTFSEHVNIASAKEYRIAGTKVLDATSLGSAVVSSSLTSVGTIGTGVWQGTAIADTYLGTISTALKVSNSATTATSANTASAIVARDASGNFTAGTITAALTGTASGNLVSGGALGTPSSGTLTNCTFPTLNQNTTGNAATVTTNANLTGDVTSVGNATTIAAGVIVDADINASAAIVDTKLATIATAGKVSNSATTATSANTASAIVARDASGNFTAGTITAALTGAASSNVLKAGDTMTGPLVTPAGTQTAAGIQIGTGTTNRPGIYSPGADQLAVATNGTGRLFVDASGNIGVGTASPFSTNGTNLHVLSTGTARLWLQSTTASTGRQFYVESLGAGGLTVVDGTAGAERLRLTATGALNFVGAGTAGSTQAVSFNGSAPVNSLVIDSLGKVGIGISSPDGTTHVHTASAGTVTANSSADDLVVENSGAGGISILTSDANNGAIFFGTPSDAAGAAIRWNYSTGEFGIGPDKAGGYLRFNSGDGTEYMRLDSSGRLGIGTFATVVSCKLNVDTGINCNGLNISGNGGFFNAANKVGIDNNGGVSRFYSSGANSSTRGSYDFRLTDSVGTLDTSAVVIDNSGRVGIGTAGPSTALQVVGTGRFGDGTNGTVSLTSSASQSYYDSLNNAATAFQPGIFRGTELIFQTNTSGTTPTTKATIDSSGRLGIGTSAPEAPLSIKAENADAFTLNLANAAVVSAFRLINGQGTAAGCIDGWKINYRPSYASGSGSGSDKTAIQLINTHPRNDADLSLLPSGGRVGIGTTPAAGSLLHINSAASTDCKQQISVTTATQAAYTAYVNTTVSTVGTENSTGGSLMTGSGPYATVISNGGAYPINFGTNNTLRATIDSSGRLLVGTTTTAAAATELLQVEGIAGNVAAGGAISLRRASVGNTDQIGIIHFKNATEGAAHASISAICDGTPAASDFPGALLFSTTADGASSPTERMRIQSDGTKEFSNGSLKLLATAVSSGAGNSTLKYNTSTGIVTYDTSSRLVKERIVACPYGIDELKRLQPRKYFRTDDQREEIGFVADEMVNVMPEFVPIGAKSVITKNAEDTEQIPIGVNYEKLTAVLTKALQEAIAKIETLEAKVAALESA